MNALKSTDMVEGSRHLKLLIYFIELARADASRWHALYNLLRQRAIPSLPINYDAKRR